MNGWRMCRVVVAVGLIMQSAPMAWAQLREVDPALNTAVDALIAHDPAVASDPELAQLCRQIAEATIVDPRERAAVAHEVAALQREGVDLASVIPSEVREAAREQFAVVQSQMREQLEMLRATDPEKAKGMELMMHEGERQMEAFATGEHYTPSPEMVEHAEKMFGEWKESMLEQGATPEMVARAEMEFGQWSSGEMMMGGPGHEFGGPGNMPSAEQMQAMGMSSEQIQMAQEYMQQGGTMPEGMMPEGFGPGPGQEYQGMNPTEAFEHWASSPEAQLVSHEQMEQYREMAEQYHPENQTYDNLQQQQFDLSQPPPGGSPPPQPEVLVAIHDHDMNGVPDEYHYDTNGDGIADHAHPTPH